MNISKTQAEQILRLFINQAFLEKPLVSARAEKIISEATPLLYENMREEEIYKAAISASTQNIKNDLSYDAVSARLLLASFYLEMLGDHYFENTLEKYQAAFLEKMESSIQHGWLSEKMRVFDFSKLASALKIERDSLLTYTGLSTLSRRYMMRAENQDILELPQSFWMRVAMGLSWNEKDPTTTAISFYEKMSRLEYVPGGSTNINAGSSVPRLSNCYLMDMEDSISSIGKTVSDVLKLSKATGGIGLSVTKLRASGSPISTNNTFSSGPIPFLHIIDSAIRAISRAGKKMGALCFYMENWHLDFQEFLDLKQNAGDDYRRARTANIAVYLSDEFMKRVVSDEAWYLFDPGETVDLVELYGADFSKRYEYYCSEAEAGRMRSYKKLRARDQFRTILVSLQATAHPWLTWKDAINVRALNNNTGTIYGSNLCTEITLPANADNVAVCNIMSLNLAKHLTPDNQINWDLLRDSVRLGIRQLDNLVDINEPPISEAHNFDNHNRAVGLGVMGLADIFESFALAYDSAGAADLTDEIMEFISYHAIDASADLAQERGIYDNFPGSRWSQGLVPHDTIQILEASRGLKVEVKRNEKLDWSALRLKVKQGMRNSTLLAIAPTANIGLVAGTSTGIDPRFAQIFSRNTLGGKYLELNPNLVKELEKLDLWEKTREQLLTSYGNLNNIPEIPEHLKEIYKDSFSITPSAFSEVAARAQKWVDQAISRNMYLETRDTDDIMKIYEEAWRSGLKTTYYLHMKPRHSAEQSTVKVNKGAALGKRGFGFALAEAPVVKKEEVVGQACPLDPQERLNCESCQ
jgi:ribonucleoside-diphosphate reductase alpha chain